MEEKRVRRGIELTEEQWRLAKSRAASRGQTLSEWFADLVTGGPMSKPMTDRPPEVSPLREDRFGTSRPAPKPGTKKR